MNAGTKNIIRQQVVEFNITSSASAFQLQQQVHDWCNDQLLPQLQEALEPFAFTSQVIRIDRLSIEVDHNNVEFGEDLAQKIREAVLKQLTDIDQPEAACSEKVAGHFIDLLLFYLQHGHLPWWSTITTRTAFEDALHSWLMNAPHQELRKIKELFRQQVIAVRALSVIPQEQRWIMYEKLSHADLVGEIRKVLMQLEQAISKHRQIETSEAIPVARIMERITERMHEALQQWIVQDKPGSVQFPLASIVATILQELGYSLSDVQIIFERVILPINRSFDVTFEQVGKQMPSVVATEPGSSSQTTVKPQPEAAEGIYISNAGLVLVARYLGDFFERTGLRQDKQFVHPALAVASLQWMVNGVENPAEFELVLPKILCGFDPQEPLQQVNEIPAFIKQEATELLGSVIKHWSVLKNTSVEGLQVSFLQRQGKLSRVEDNWLLQVEQKPYDMLLEHLPWTIGIIKLSFMREAVYVEWL